MLSSVVVATSAPAGHRKSHGWRDFVNGAILSWTEALTLGLPLEVIKTRMGRFRTERTLEATRKVYADGGLKSFWRGGVAKSVEASTKGAVLLWAKELTIDVLTKAGVGGTPAGFVGGGVGGVAQTVVLAPTTMMVTAAVTGGQKRAGVVKMVTDTYRQKGIRGFYPGGSAIAARQASNWAFRQGFTDSVRGVLKRTFHEGNEQAKLTPGQEILAGVIGGAISTINQPVEVARIEMQAAAFQGEKARGVIETLKLIYAEHGIRGLFKGLPPRIALGIYQTVAMVSAANIIRDHILR